MNTWSKLRAWIKTNIIGEESDSDYREQQSSKEEELQADMDEMKVIPPDPFPAHGGINRKFIEFWVEKVLDFAVSGIGALFAWIVLKVSGKHLFPEERHGAKAVETILPVIIWVACFVRLHFLRVAAKRARKI